MCVRCDPKRDYEVEVLYQGKTVDHYWVQAVDEDDAAAQALHMASKCGQIVDDCIVEVIQ